MPATLYQCDLPLRRPLATARGSVSQRSTWILALEAGGGMVGLGEAAPLPGFGGEPEAACERGLRRALELLTATTVARFVHGGDPARPLEPALEDALAGAPCARHAVEGALVDLASQVRGVPLCEFLAAGCGRSVAVNALVDGPADAGWAVAAGFRTLKAKATANPIESAELVARLRDAAGEGIRLRLDANAGWDADTCARFGESVPLDSLEYLEQPLAAGDLAGAAALRPRLGVPLALDESIRSAADVGRVGNLSAADVVVLKPMFLGGWRPLKQAVALARAYGMGVVVTTALESAVGRAYATHLAAAAAAIERAHGLATGDRLTGDLVSEPLVPEDGLIRLRDRPGLGIGALVG